MIRNFFFVLSPLNKLILMTFIKQSYGSRSLPKSQDIPKTHPNGLCVINIYYIYCHQYIKTPCVFTLHKFDCLSQKLHPLKRVMIIHLSYSQKVRADSVHFPGEEKFSIENGFFVTITQNSSYIGRTQMPDRCYLQPTIILDGGILQLRSDKMSVCSYPA